MASSKQTLLHESPSYPQLIKYFHYNWVLAAEVLFGVYSLSKQQKELINHASKEAVKVSVSSGHGTGKSYLQGLIILIFIILHPNSQVVVLSNTVKQTRRGVWKNLGIHFKNLQKHAPWIARHFVMTDTMFYAKGAKQEWNVEVKAIQNGNFENLAGEHNEHLLIIVDEASGVPSGAFGVLLGALSSGDNRMILLSQPTRNAGFFYDTHHTMSIANDPERGWITMVMSSVDSPHVTAKFIRDRALEYGGVDSLHFRIKVLGMFPDKVDGFLLGRSQLQACISRHIEFNEAEWGWLACCDLGHGRDKSVISLFRVQGEIGRSRLVQQVATYEMPNEMLTDEFATKIINLCIDSGDYPNITIAVDAHGAGRDLVGMLEKRRPSANIVGVKWGDKPFRKIEKEMYINLRAKAHMLIQDAVLKGRLSITQGMLTAKTIEQGAKLPYFMNDVGQYQMMKKEVMKQKEGIPSPDIFDTYCFTQLVDIIPANDPVYDSYDEDMWDGWEEAS
ncbi:terminase [Vibrio fluvialis]|nr:terminase [Vibrio fluvialis]